MAFGNPGPFADRQNPVLRAVLGQVFDLEDGHRGRDLGLGIERRIDVEVRRIWMRLDEQRTAALTFEILYDLPCMLLVFHRIGADQ